MPPLRRHLSTLPRGVPLSGASWRQRHRLLVVVLAAHLPVYALTGLMTEAESERLAAALLPLGAVTAAACIRAAGRLWRTIAVTAGFTYASALLVHLTGGLVEAQLHSFVALALVALYQDWRPFALLIGGVTLHHGLVAGLGSAALLEDAVVLQAPWRWVVVHGAILIILVAAILVSWKAAEREAIRSRRLRHELYEGERALARQLLATETVKSEIVAVVSHEFRTPLTAIIGYTQLLARRLDELDEATTRRHLQIIDEQARRLARIVHNIEAMSGAVPVDRGAVTDLALVAAQVADEIAGAYRERALIHLELPSALPAAIHGDAAHQVLANLIDNAVKFATPGTVVRVRGQEGDDEVALTITNDSQLLADEPEILFDAFTQGDSSDTRRADGVGLGLPVARKLLEAHGGELSLAEVDGRVVARVTVPLAEQGCPDIVVQRAVVSHAT